MCPTNEEIGQAIYDRTSDAAVSFGEAYRAEHPGQFVIVDLKAIGRIADVHCGQPSSDQPSTINCSFTAQGDAARRRRLPQVEPALLSASDRQEPRVRRPAEARRGREGRDGGADRARLAARPAAVHRADPRNHEAPPARGEYRGRVAGAHQRGAARDQPGRVEDRARRRALCACPNGDGWPRSAREGAGMS